MDLTLAEYLEQEQLVALLQIQRNADISPDMIRRIERLEKIVFGDIQH